LLRCDIFPCKLDEVRATLSLHLPKALFRNQNFGIMYTHVQNNVQKARLSEARPFEHFCTSFRNFYLEMRCWQDAGEVYLTPRQVCMAKYAHLSNPQQSPQQLCISLIKMPNGSKMTLKTVRLLRLLSSWAQFLSYEVET
jgi:hypothetical protein